jgi:hypothetical protein
MVENDDLWNWSLIDIRLSERRTFLFVPPLAGRTKTLLCVLSVSVVRQELDWGCDSYGI